MVHHAVWQKIIEALQGQNDCTHLKDLKQKNNNTEEGETGHTCRYRAHAIMSSSLWRMSWDKHQVLRVKHCLTCSVRSYPALFLLLLGVLVLQAADTRHTGQAVETGDALTWVLTSNPHVWWTRKLDIKRGRDREENRKINWSISKPFILSGLLKAPCMTAWASSFLSLRASMVSLRSISSESYKTFNKCQWVGLE